MQTRRVLGITLTLLLAAGLLGWRIVMGGIEEHYSPGWHSASTENAQYRGVYVSSPAVQPSVLHTSDSVALAVTDAWIERPTRVRYRWWINRRESQDTTYRLVIHLARVVHDSTTWTSAVGRAPVLEDILIDGKQPARTGNANVQTVYQQSSAAFPDTVRLSIRP